MAFTLSKEGSFTKSDLPFLYKNISSNKTTDRTVFAYVTVNTNDFSKCVMTDQKE